MAYAYTLLRSSLHNGSYDREFERRGDVKAVHMWGKTRFLLWYRVKKMLLQETTCLLSHCLVFFFPPDDEVMPGWMSSNMLNGANRLENSRMV